MPKRLFEVTFIGQVGEQTVIVRATSKEDARRKIKQQYPTAHIIHVEGKGNK
jgi:hypothetical protein